LLLRQGVEFLLQPFTVLLQVALLLLLDCQLLLPGLVLLLGLLELVPPIALLLLLLTHLVQRQDQVGFFDRQSVSLLELRRQVIKAAFQDTEFGFELAGLFLRLFCHLIILVELQQISQDLFAIARTFQHELVGASLAQVCRVDEGVIIQTQVLADPLLGGAHSFFGQRSKSGGGLHLKFQGSGLPSVAAAENAVGVIVALEGKIDQRLQGTLVNDVVFTGGATLSPDDPGDRFQKRRFTRPIGTTNTSHVQPAKVEGRRLVAEEVFEAEVLRNHC
jgi:hypothetical protein